MYFITALSGLSSILIVLFLHFSHYLLYYCLNRAIIGFVDFIFPIHNKPARLAFRRADIFQLCSLKIVTRAALYECPCPL